MTKTLRGWACLVWGVPVALLAACSTPQKVRPTPVQEVVQVSGKTVVSVGQSDSGASVVLEPNQELRVALPLDGDEVRDNLDWRLAQIDLVVLELMNSRFEPGERGGRPTDAGGTTVWRFKSKGKGSVALAFELRRFRSLEVPSKTITYDVTVK